MNRYAIRESCFQQIVRDPHTKTDDIWNSAAKQSRQSVLFDAAALSAALWRPVHDIVRLQVSDVVKRTTEFAPEL